MPTPELDLVAFKPGDNTLLIIEVKSYLDSPGVKYEDACKTYNSLNGRYKLFSYERYRQIVTRRLLDLFTRDGLVTGGVTVQYVLVAGKVYRSDEPRIRAYFEQRGWVLVGPSEVADSIRALAKKRWEDSVPMMVVKILNQNPPVLT
ncbi:MAG: hypothetical protein HPY55_11080 [Firmicutes bacterium]|nr:hypothetical protein [Bacillota bacterium]